MAGRIGARLAGELKDAQENIGFFNIRNHGISQELIDRMFSTTAQFHALPLDQKLAIQIDKDQTGYLPMKGTLVKTGDIPGSNKPDLSEARWIRRDRPDDDPEILAGLRFRKNKWPSNVPGFKQTTIEHMKAMESLGSRLLPVYAVALGLESSYFDSMFDRADTPCRL